VYGIVCLWWYLHFDTIGSSITATATEGNGAQETAPLTLLLASLFLPGWCYLSYQSIFVSFSYKTILYGGLLVELAHAFVFAAAMKQLSDTFHLIMLIASGLFFIETAAFLTVVTAFRPASGITGRDGSNRMEPTQYQDISEVV
jgi:hypothetical protein